MGPNPDDSRAHSLRLRVANAVLDGGIKPVVGGYIKRVSSNMVTTIVITVFLQLMWHGSSGVTFHTVTAPCLKFSAILGMPVFI